MPRGTYQRAIHFRCAEYTANPDKYRDELLDAYLFVKMPTHFMPSTQRKA